MTLRSVESILVVDDDLSIRETLARQLTAEGYDVQVADGAESAMRLLGRHEFMPSLVITDLRMAGMSGLQLLTWLRESHADVDVIMITAHEDMETAMAAMKSGAREFLVKPLDLDELERVVQRCFDDRSARRRARDVDRAAEDPAGFRRAIGKDAKMIAISKTIGSLASNRTPVLIRGETGTGKEVIARTIHFNSPAAEEPFIAINCTAIPEALLESELFGHVRGAFTGAAGDRKGRFELAGNGTIFLDEIGDVGPAFQTKLLRVLQDGEFYAVGAERPRRTTARVIAATHRPLEQLVASGEFREDLYFRLRVVELVIPPLRERRGDILTIANALVTRLGQQLQQPLSLSAKAKRALEQHDWPGNVRELENALTRGAALARSCVIDAADLVLGSTRFAARNDALAADDVSLGIAVRQHVERVLASTDGNKRRAARLLGISRQRLDRIILRSLAADRDVGSDESLPEGGEDDE